MKFHGDKTLLLTVVVATGALLLAACSSVPKWVDKGGGYMNEKDGKAFYGVGAVMGIRNEPLAKETADNRARADLAKYMDTYEEQNVERALKTFVSTHLSGVMVVDRWEKEDKTGKTIYSLAKLDLDKFKDQVGQMKDLNEAARDFVRKNAEKAFERLQQEEDKRGAK